MQDENKAARLKDYVLKELSDKFEVVSQDNYVYAYLRSGRGYGLECNIMSFPLNYEASISYGLSYMEAWKDQDSNWQSKDMIVLFYDDRNKKSGLIGDNYARSVQEFLQSYFTSTN